MKHWRFLVSTVFFMMLNMSVDHPSYTIASWKIAESVTEGNFWLIGTHTQWQNNSDYDPYISHFWICVKVSLSKMFRRRWWQKKSWKILLVHEEEERKELQHYGWLVIPIVAAIIGAVGDQDLLDCENMNI